MGKLKETLERIWVIGWLTAFIAMLPCYLYAFLSDSSSLYVQYSISNGYEMNMPLLVLFFLMIYIGAWFIGSISAVTMFCVWIYEKIFKKQE